MKNSKNNEIKKINDKNIENKIDSLGYLKIYGLSQDRIKNNFIHEYHQEKKDDKLFFTPI